MDKPRYADATWSLLVDDLATGKSLYALNADQLSLTGSTRKLFSVAVALDQLGADHRQATPVYRRGDVRDGVLDGDLIMVAAGDLAFGGRRSDANTIEYTNFDHNDANSLGTAILTPQDPLFAVNELARQVKAAGIDRIRGDVIIDDRLFTPYRVPNGNLLITPMMINENMVDVTATPGAIGGPPAVTHRPVSAALAVRNAAATATGGTASSLKFSDDSRPTCIGRPGCTGTITGELPIDYQAPFTGATSKVATFRVEDPAAYARTVFAEALQRQGVAVRAEVVGANPAAALPSAATYTTSNRVASHTSAPYAQTAQLVLKVSLNLGANTALSLFGVTQQQRTVQGALAAERERLTGKFGVTGDQFDFPTNGSGTPDSRAAPRAIVQLLTAMSTKPTAEQFRNALPIMGVDGSLATSGTDLPARGKVRAKTGTTVDASEDGTGIELKAQNFAGYIDTKSGRRVAFALMVNNAGKLTGTEDIGNVIADEAAISNAIWANL